VELREALAIMAGLVAENPGRRDLRLSITNHHASLGFVLLEQKRQAEAEAEYREAVRIQEGLVADDPTDHDLKDSLAISHLNLGRLLAGTDQAAKAEVEYRQAIAILAAIAREQPAMVVYRLRLATTHRFLGEVLRRSGRPSEAERELRETLAITVAAAETMSGAIFVNNEVATAHNNLGDAIRAQGRTAEARDCYERAIAIRERLVKEDLKTPIFRSHLAWSLRRRGLTRIDLGDLAGGIADTRRALNLWDGLNSLSGEEWFETGCAHATLAGLAARVDSGVPPDAAPAEALGAIRALRRAIGLGYRDGKAIRAERALDPVRDQPDFKALLMDLAVPADPFAP
ncbi:MAG: tetratricopeptide repeat protein, partial [Thermoleophilia bacterium]|nr:tetratricopeptide repeat protein [Thermoleophilia bacterium]